MQLSILLPTNRHGLVAIARIAQVCSWASPSIEVIIRDNSGNAEKAALISHFRNENCNVIIAEPCHGLENSSEIIRMAKGDFVFLVADDDACFEHGIAALPPLLDQASNDASIIGVTGSYAVETSRQSAVVAYQDTDSEDLGARIAGYLKYDGPNILQYSPVKAVVLRRVFGFMGDMPFFFSFHDQIMCLLYLMNGRFLRLQRLLYLYDVGPWEEREGGQKQDMKFYESAGLDPVINKLHWFLCGFEGATLVRNGTVFPDHPLAQRQRIADLWFSTMFQRFVRDQRATFGSPHVADAEKLCAKLQASAGQLSFKAMLSDISDFFALFSKQQGQRYFEFWDAVLDKRQPPAHAKPAAIRRSYVA